MGTILSFLSSTATAKLLYYHFCSYIWSHTYNISATKKNLPSSPSRTKNQENDKLEPIKKLIESKSNLIEERINKVRKNKRLDKNKARSR